jgi:hypothetical protein
MAICTATKGLTTSRMVREALKRALHAVAPGVEVVAKVASGKAAVVYLRIPVIAMACKQHMIPRWMMRMMKMRL